jgi:predicted P-loop ATPase
MSDEQMPPPEVDEPPPFEDEDAPPALHIAGPDDDPHTEFTVIPWLPKSLGGACKVLRGWRELTLGPGELKFNELTESIEFAGKPLLEADQVRWREQVELRIRGTNAKGHTSIQFSGETARDAFTVVAHENPYHPVREYLNSVSRTPGAPSVIEMIARKAFHQTNDLPKALFRMFCIGAVARAMDPGCKHDHLLVLIGDEACHKSQAVKALCDPWVSDTDLDLDDQKRALSMLNKFWVHEIAELKSFKGKKGHAIKQFLSSPVDNYIPFGGGKGAVEKRQPRACVFIGTSNDRTPLSDPTGNRRTHPILIPKPIDLKLIRQFKDDIWAEAVEAYRAGEQWWPTEAQAVELRGNNEELMEEDPWEEDIERWLENPPPGDANKPITTTLILSILGVTTSRKERGAQMRVADILKQLGYTQQPQKRFKGAVIRPWEPDVTKVATRKALKSLD